LLRRLASVPASFRNPRQCKLPIFSATIASQKRKQIRQNPNLDYATLKTTIRHPAGIADALLSLAIRLHLTQPQQDRVEFFTPSLDVGWGDDFL